MGSRAREVLGGNPTLPISSECQDAQGECALFESWVVAEIVKQRFNRGEANGVYFFRDKAGLECDVLAEGRAGLKLVEV